MTTFFSTLLLFIFLYLVVFKFIDRYLRLQLLVSALSVLKMYDLELKLYSDRTGKARKALVRIRGIFGQNGKSEKGFSPNKRYIRTEREKRERL
ncbi:hypothetical protein PZE06_08665 [Robertmurraya sp. DFI.2.37]|uniref:hypothetical protein n=1 Tax=Robertmurraya sp. DFI.2.37 TaxID=3031819 RepID=UPI0023DA9199|nr:hypothetical protein [Robertmurraya sp. DFI.2.37]MDF1508257.1 hypothetical protein [Robertmurraya sp. DFI.2.37]